MTMETQLQKQFEAETGLRLERISTPAQLARTLDRGLAKLYAGIFAEAPYFEKFQEQEVREYFLGLFEAGGCILVAFDGGNIAGFAASQPLASKKGLPPEVTRRFDADKAAYFSEDAVAPAYRRRGISGRMKALL